MLVEWTANSRRRLGGGDVAVFAFGTMKPFGYWTAILVGVAGIVSLGFLTIGHATPGVLGLTLTTAGALTLITGGSVAIERVLEAFWTIVDLTSGSSWPGGPQARKLREALEQVSSTMRPKLDALEADLTKALNAAPPADERHAKVDHLLAGIRSIRATLNAASKTSDSATLAKAMSSITSHFDAVARKYPLLTDGKSTNDLVDEAIDAATAFQQLLGTFESNPARRLVSIVAGANLGVLVAFLLGLNVFTTADAMPTAGAPAAAQAASLIAVPSPTSPKPSNAPAQRIWILVTGLVMGLGSSPTHELIRAVQQQKLKSSKADS